MIDREQVAAILRDVTTLSPRQLVKRMNKFAADISAGGCKEASLGGEQDQGFEQSFASLAYTYIADKAPGLLDYLIGFQLVDRNEKDTKAVGVFGFKVGPQWMYVPVFFLSGDIKGHELLFLKSQQMFVPLKENWINYLVNKRPQQLGEGVSNNAQELGVLKPQLQNAVRSLGGLKFSSLQQRPWARETKVIEQMVRESGNLDTVKRAAAFFGNEYPSSSPLDLGKLLATSPSLTEATVHICEAWPGVKRAMDVHYGRDFLSNVLKGHIQQAEKQAAEEAKKPARILQLGNRVPVNRSKKKVPTSIFKGAASDNPKEMAVSKVEIITENLPTLTEEERQKLLRDGKLIKDHRDGEEKTVAYDTTTPMALCNPDITGTYDVLIGQGEFEKCLVIFGPYDGNKRRRYVTVVRLDGERNWINVHPSRVFIRQAAEPDTREKNDWFKDLPGSDGKPSRDGTYVAVSVSGEGTVPFRPGAEFDDGLLEAAFMDDGCESADGPIRNYGFSPSCCGTLTLQFDKRKGDSFLTQNGNTYVPDDAKLIKISDPPKCAQCSEPEVDCTCDYFRYDRYAANKLKPIILGDLSDLQLALRHKTAALKIVEDASEFVINNVRMPKSAGVVHLVRDLGLDEVEARGLLKEAEMYSGIRRRVKYAAGYPSGMGMGGFPPPTGGGDGGYMGPSEQYMDPYSGSDSPYGGMSANMIEPIQMSEQVPGLQASQTDPNIYDPMANMDPMALQTAQKATQTGQKEVFDTAMFSSLTRSIRPDSLVDGDLGNIAETVNILGRMLFLFYWHNEEFQERYGKKDLPELSDTLRNAFEMLGDLLLYLRQKSVDNVFGTNLRDASPDIGDAAGN